MSLEIDVRHKVLIVDDEPLIRYMLAESLRGWGYGSCEAATLAEAKAIFEKTNPDAVLLDINLPDGSGMNLLREIKGRQPQTIVILMTAEVVVENAVAALRSGANDFISKPINLDHLQSMLRQQLNTKLQAGRNSSATRPSLLLVTDSPERMSSLAASLNPGGSEITQILSLSELVPACQHKHDLVVVDLASPQLERALKTIRDSHLHADTPILVAIGRVLGDPAVAGLLPQFRAMPCSPSELVTLTRRRLSAPLKPQPARALL